MPLGVSGVITMKMISSTSRMSISGTTFISAIAPPLLSPTLIPIALLLLACPGELSRPVKPRRVGAARPVIRANERTATSANCPSLVGWRLLLTGRWRNRRLGALVLLRQQPELIHSGRPDLI